MKKLFSILLAVMLCAVSAFGAFAEADAQGGYVLMNIPYDAFYAAEADNASALDAVSSSTLMKPRTAGLAGGSYHVDPEGSDISGVIFPVHVEDMSALAAMGGVEITDESSVEITVTNRGEESTTVFTGAEALFEAPSYSWYVLSDEPAVYKTLSDGVFGAVNAEPAALEAEAAFVYDRHADMVIRVNGADEALENVNVSAVVLTADDGTRVGLRHIANLWRKAQIGFALDGDIYAALKGKRVAKITYYTPDGLYSVDADLAIPDDPLLPRLNGTYIDLFPEFAKEDFKEYWMECIGEYVDDAETAEACYAAMTQGFMGTLKGQEAIDAYGADPASMVFDCYLENGLSRFTVNGDVFSGVDAEGNEIFRHAYHYLEDVDVTFYGQPTGTQLHVYATDDADAGMFTYFAFADDTIAETQHVEFRYGESLENMGSYTEGEYAYWLAGAINDNYKESQIKDCIHLFVSENLGEEEAEAGDAEPIEIDTAEALAAVADDLSGYYVLTADIDLGGAEWTPLGAFVSTLDENGEASELPDMTAAFTGQGHTISNYVINQPEGYALGLFGCVANATIENLSVKDATVDGTTMLGAVVGYTFSSTIANVNAENVAVTAHASEMSAEGMYGGIAGAGMASRIEGCAASADLVIPDGTANAGIVGGGLEMTDVVDCTASGSITAGNGCYGLGGVSGCGFASVEFTGNTAENVTITAGDGCYWIGGVTGYAGGFEDETLGMPVTAFTDCHAKNVAVTAGENVDGVGAIVGAGFFYEGLAEAYGIEAYANPTVFTVTDCDSEGATLNGEALE